MMMFSLFAILECDGKIGLESGCLPHFTVERQLWADIAPIISAIQTKYTIAVEAIRCVEVDYDQKSPHLAYYLTTNTPSNKLNWVEPSAAAFDGFQARAVNSWMAWCLASHRLRVDWYRPGWLDRVKQWLVASDLPNDNLIQLRSCQRSAILTTQRQDETYYLKAAPPQFHFEGALTAFLHELFPDHIPAVLAENSAENWFLMPDCGAVNLEEHVDLAVWCAALTKLAEMQIALIEHVPSLEKMGLPRLDLAYVETHLEAMVEAAVGLEPEDAHHLQTKRPIFQNALAILKNSPIPMSLKHGDLWPGQILFGKQGQPVFIDWSDASIAHPFFDFGYFWVELDLHQQFVGQPDARLQLEQAYLAPWQAFASPAQVQPVFDAARTVAQLHFALHYGQNILPNMEIAWEMELMLPYYLKLALRS